VKLIGTEAGESGNHRAALPRALSYLRPVVAVGLIAALLLLVPPKGIVEQVRGARLGLVALAFLIMFATIVVSSLKLWVLVRTVHAEASFLGVLRAYYVGTFFNNFLPTGVGGDLLKINELRVQGVPVRHAAASAVVERATGIMIVLALAVAVPLGWGRLFAQPALRPMRWPLAGVGVGFFALLIAFYALWQAGLKAYLKARREGKVLGRVYWVAESFYVFRNDPGSLALAFVLSALFYALLATNIVVVVSSVGAGVGPGEAVGIIPMVKLPEILPSMGGLGVREGVMTYCLAHLGPSAAQAAAVALLLRLLTWVHSGIGGCVYALGCRRRA
jgi:uncharacterized protein (TIRG00374 family)